MKIQIVEEIKDKSNHEMRHYQEMEEYIQNLADQDKTNFKFRSNLVSFWTILIIIANLLQIVTAFDNLNSSDQVVEENL